MQKSGNARSSGVLFFSRSFLSLSRTLSAISSSSKIPYNYMPDTFHRLERPQMNSCRQLTRKQHMAAPCSPRPVTAWRKGDPSLGSDNLTWLPPTTWTAQETAPHERNAAQLSLNELFDGLLLLYLCRRPASLRSDKSPPRLDTRCRTSKP